MVVGKTGAAEVPTDPMPPEATDLMVILKPQDEWKTKKSYTELGDEINEALEVIHCFSNPIRYNTNKFKLDILKNLKRIKGKEENLNINLLTRNLFPSSDSIN